MNNERKTSPALGLRGRIGLSVSGPMLIVKRDDQSEKEYFIEIQDLEVEVVDKRAFIYEFRNGDLDMISGQTPEHR